MYPLAVEKGPVAQTETGFTKIIIENHENKMLIGKHFQKKNSIK